jgi:uncharacterized protein (TIGR00297 family)
MLLIFLFVSANLLSRYQQRRKEAFLTGIVEKGGERDAWQVAANGGVFTLLAMAALAHPSAMWLPIAAGSISASTADTWATEIGTLSASPPRSITSRLIVPVGTSGGVTWLGTWAGLAGALCIALLALVFGWGVKAAAGAVVGGIAGSLVDSLVGATIQRLRWCDTCQKATERAVHGCGTKTRAAGGIEWIDNDVVNAISSITGAVAGGMLLL